jgi:ribonuclease VapC
MSNDGYVHDASVVLAFLRRETGAERARGMLADAHISAANIIEVRSRLLDLGMEDNLVDDLVGPLPLTVHPLTEKHARTAATLRIPTRKIGLSLGDRACLALAIERNATAVTMDRAWADLNLGVNVLVLR